jgi:hypothetical protein
MAHRLHEEEGSSGVGVDDSIPQVHTGTLEVSSCILSCGIDLIITTTSSSSSNEY